MQRNMLLNPAEESGTSSKTDFAPTYVMELEIGQPLPTVLAYNKEADQHYRRAKCLVRLHSQPLGVVELIFEGDEIKPQELATSIWQSLAEPIVGHLHEDGLPTTNEMTETGLPTITTPHCLKMRESFLSTAPFVSVIIPTHDRSEKLRACLDSLLALNYPNYEIIVVDNAPTNSATADLVQQHYGDEVRIHYSRENRPGTSWARNCGIKVARGEILAFTDDDVAIDSCWLAELVRGFRYAENVACVTGLILPREIETEAQFWFEKHGGFSKGFTRRIFDMGKYHPREPWHPFIASRFGSGASMAFTSAFLHKVGGFDHALGSKGPCPCGQDIAMLFQVIARGYRLVYEPSALLYHQHHRDYSELRKQLYSYGVGFTAHLTKTVMENPLRLLDLVFNLPSGLLFMWSRRKSASYPKELIRLEGKGMLYGPFAYLQSRSSVTQYLRSSNSPSNGI